MCEISERIKEEGRKEGLLEGRQEGCQEAHREKISEMLLKVNTPKEIADFCGYSLELIKEVQDGMLTVR